MVSDWAAAVRTAQAAMTSTVVGLNFILGKVCSKRRFCSLKLLETAVSSTSPSAEHSILTILEIKLALVTVVVFYFQTPYHHTPFSSIYHPTTESTGL